MKTPSRYPVATLVFYYEQDGLPAALLIDNFWVYFIILGGSLAFNRLILRFYKSCYHNISKKLASKKMVIIDYQRLNSLELKLMRENKKTKLYWAIL